MKRVRDFMLVITVIFSIWYTTTIFKKSSKTFLEVLINNTGLNEIGLMEIYILELYKT